MTAGMFDELMRETTFVAISFMIGGWILVATLDGPRRYLSLIIRNVKPFQALVAFLIVVYSTLRLKQSLLEILVDWIREIRRGNNIQDPVLSNLFAISIVLVENTLAVLLLHRVFRGAYCLLTLSLADFQRALVNTTFAWVKDNVPVVRARVEKEAQQVAHEAHASLPKTGVAPTTALPERGRSPESVIAELRNTAETEDVDWKRGHISGTVYGNNEQHSQLLQSVYGIYCWSNPLHIGTWPRLNQCEAEVVAMTADALHCSPPIGTMTAGGTESILLAIRASLRYYGDRRSIRYPELVCGSTAHAAVDKACELLGIRKVVVDCSSPPYTLDPSKVRRAMTSNTILIYGSAPCYPQGVVDPIEDLSEIALEYQVGLHVDACLGGFVLAFLEEGDAPRFDFRLLGVTSVSIDTHKYGYATKGTSVVLYRHAALRQGQYFCYPHWSGGIYITPTVAGSRPGGLSVCAWAAMVHVGREGYRERALSIVKTARAIAVGVEDIPGLRLLTKPRPYMVVCIGSSDGENDDDGGVGLDIYRVHDAMRSLGWNLNTMQNPASIHFCVTLNAVGLEATFLHALREATQQVRKQQEEDNVAGTTKKPGTAGIYGMVGSVPAGPLEFVLGSYMDASLSL